MPRDVCPRCDKRVEPIPRGGKGLSTILECPACGEREQMSRWHFKTIEEKKAAKREYHKEYERIYKPRRAALMRARYHSDPEYRERKKRRSHDYYVKNRERCMERKRRWYAENPDRAALIRKRCKLRQLERERARMKMEE